MISGSEDGALAVPCTRYCTKRRTCVLRSRRAEKAFWDDLRPANEATSRSYMVHGHVYPTRTDHWVTDRHLHSAGWRRTDSSLAHRHLQMTTGTCRHGQGSTSHLEKTTGVQLSLRRPMVLRMMQGIAAEPNPVDLTLWLHLHGNIEMTRTSWK